jgi:tetratricopeptide (TPR) repeat protein
MALDPYSTCPCGSGKKFKWCCEPIYAEIRRAFDQEANGQQETALRIMNDLIKEHPGNPEAWGKRAELLYHHGKIEEAEQSLEKAFAINPNYPWGLLLRAIVRFQEGEIPGSLLLARKAADAYHPDAHDHLARAYSVIFECEMSLNRPVAGRAAMRSILRNDPADEELRQRFDAIFGEESGLPAAARKEYELQAPTTSERRAAWDAAFKDAVRLSDMAKGYEQIVQADAADTPAWFNLGLTKAWLGDNRAAVQALDRYLERETDDARAATAATLQEVLRCGAGMEDDSDYLQHVFFQPVRDPAPINALVQSWVQSHRILPLQTQQQGTLAAILLEHSSSLITVGNPGAEIARLAGYLLIAGGMMQVSSPLKEPLERLRDEVRSKLTLGIDALQTRKAPISFQDVTAEALVFPLRPAQNQTDEERVLGYIQKYYEETWIHRPRLALSNNAPVDAAGHATLKKKLRGVIQFIQDCAAHGIVGKYDFDRLRRKLGLLGGGAPAVATGTAAAPTSTPAAATVGDIGAMGAAELAALKVDELSNEQLEQAYQTAHKLDASELAIHFVKGLLARPANPERPDRYPWYSFVVQQAIKEGRLDEALDMVNDGERVDCEQNEGKRRNDYELRRGQVHIKRGEADAAQDVFQRLIDRVPDNFKFRGAAAEAMLAAKQPARALKFAEEGLAAARQANDRDSEGYLMELVEATKRQKG